MFGSPFAPSSYYHPSDYYNNPYSRGPSLAQQRALAQAAARQQAIERQRAAQRSSRRHQYLPHEYDDGDGDDSDGYDGGSYSYYTPYDRLYLDGLRRKEAMERARKEEESINQRRLEAQRQEQLWREQEQQRREQMKHAHRQHQTHTIPIRTRSPPSRPPSSQPAQKASTYRHSPSPARPAEPPVRPPSPQTLERRNNAATLIQNFFRIHHSITKLKDLEKQFQSLKDSYNLPITIDFQSPNGGIISVSVPHLPSNEDETSNTASSETDTPKLAYNSTNYSLHSYTESLNRLLLKLDSIESWGDANVRKTRKGLASRVEGEASRVEEFWKRVWVVYASGGRGDDQAMDEAEVIDGGQREKLQPSEDADEQKMDEDQENEDAEAKAIAEDAQGETKFDDGQHQPQHEADNATQSDREDEKRDPNDDVVIEDAGEDVHAESLTGSQQDSSILGVQPLNKEKAHSDEDVIVTEEDDDQVDAAEVHDSLTPDAEDSNGGADEKVSENIALEPESQEGGKPDPMVVDDFVLVH